MTSVVSICNRALQKVGANPIADITEDSKSANECNRCYAELRDTELQANNWNFAIKRASIAASTTDPVWGYDNQFPLPTDCLRLINIDGFVGVMANIGTQGNQTSDYLVEGNMILANDSGPLNIRYVAQTTDVSKYHPQFREALAARIAMEISESLTQSNTTDDRLANWYGAVIQKARYTDGIETPAVALYEDDWLTARL